jgi:nucleotide-binding universal stress UspA family protein
MSTSMANIRPILVALPLDHETPDIVAATSELARRLEAPIVVVHAIPSQRLETEARTELEPHLASLRDAGVDVQDVVVAVGRPAEESIALASRLAAQMIVTGGGRPATIRRWVVGSVAEAIVRGSTIPVWVARGKPPSGRPLLCPVDLSAESKIGLDAAVRMARLFELPLSIITVVSEESQRDREEDEAAARKQVEALLATYDVAGLDVSVDVTTGDPAERIVDAADEAGLLVVASRGYDPLVREWLGPVTTRALRHSLCSALTIRHVGEGHDERMRAITRLADLYRQAMDLLADGQGEEALPMLEGLAEQAPTNAAVQEAFAIALERVGRSVEATSRHELATLIRERIR